MLYLYYLRSGDCQLIRLKVVRDGIRVVLNNMSVFRGEREFPIYFRYHMAQG
jgi:hypothetical protein